TYRGSLRLPLWSAFHCLSPVFRQVDICSAAGFHSLMLYSRSSCRIVTGENWWRAVREGRGRSNILTPGSWHVCTLCNECASLTRRPVLTSSHTRARRSVMAITYP